MKNSNQLQRWIRVACFVAFSFVVQTAGVFVRADDAPELLNCQQYVSNVGRKLEFYFTVEYAAPTDGSPSPFEVARYQEDRADIKSVDDLLVHLKKTLKDIEIVQDPCHPEILHLVDAKASRDASYPLQSRLTLRYSGVLAELPEAIGVCVPRVGTQRSGFHWTESDNDTVTKVNLSVGMPQTVRQILTDAVPTPYSARPGGRMLWKSTYTSVGTQGRFGVRYPYPGKD